MADYSSCCIFWITASFRMVINSHLVLNIVHFRLLLIARRLPFFPDHKVNPFLHQGWIYKTCRRTSTWCVWSGCCNGCIWGCRCNCRWIFSRDTIDKSFFISVMMHFFFHFYNHALFINFWKSIIGILFLFMPLIFPWHGCNLMFFLVVKPCFVSILYLFYHIVI